MNGGVIPWINCNVLSQEEIQDLRTNGVEITNFSYVIPPDDTGAIESAISTIAEHHPGKSIWVERINCRG